MGTQAAVAVEAADRATALGASEAAIGALETTEARLSTWRDGSELSRLNRSPVGEPFALSPELADELQAAWRCAARTDGAFEPAVGPLVAAWGLRSGGRQPERGDLALALAAAGDGAFELQSGAAVRRQERAAIEEGGFGKGAGLDRAIAAGRAAGALRIEIDLGGQVAWWDADPQAAYRVELADPRDRGRPLIEIALAVGSLATSGNSERGIIVDGRRLGHVLDPRSGRPAADFGSIAVWSRSAFDADCLSTALYVLGPAAALEWAALHDDVEVVVLQVTASGVEVLASAGLHGRVRSLPIVQTEDESIVPEGDSGVMQRDRVGGNVAQE